MTRRAVLLMMIGIGGLAWGTGQSRVVLRPDDEGEKDLLLRDTAIQVLRVTSDNGIEAIVDAGDLQRLQHAGVDVEVLIGDLAGHFERQLSGTKGGVFGNYYLYTEVDQAARALQTRFPLLCKVDSLPTRSIENRALYVIKVSSSPGTNNGKPEVLISGAIHAYEPIGPSVCMNEMTYLCEHYASDPEVRWLMDNRQVYFIPVLNPDGYVYNETYPGRMWRKNRRNNGGSYGVDLNRNYPYKWGYDDIGSSPIPSAWNYRGTAPASEPETRAVVDFVNAHRFRIWQNHHSPNDVLLIPFGYIDSYPYNDTFEYNTICREESLLYGFNKWGNSYRAYGYLVNGGMEDWAWCDSATYKIFGLVPELGMDYWEGLTDSSKIVNVCQRMLQAEVYLMQAAGFYPRVTSVVVHDSPPGGNNDGVLNPGERARIRIALKNKAVVDTAFGLAGFLSTAYPHLRVTDTAGTYGNVIRLATVSNNADPFAVACSTSARPNDWVRFDLRVVWNSGNYQKTLACSLRIGPITGVGEQKQSRFEDFSIEISPNPARLKTSLVLRGVWAAGPTAINIYDATGRLLRHFDVPGGLSSFSIPHMVFPGSGVYFVEVRAGPRSVTRKIVLLP